MGANLLLVFILICGAILCGDLLGSGFGLIDLKSKSQLLLFGLIAAILVLLCVCELDMIMELLGNEAIE